MQLTKILLFIQLVCKELDQWFTTIFLEAPQHCMFSMSP